MADGRQILNKVEAPLTYDLLIGDINLYKAPLSLNLPPSIALALGDNHGNTLKLIFLLMWLEIVKNENYLAFFKNFKGFLKAKPDYSVLMGEFFALKAKFNFISKPHLIFIGDLFSERVGNDALNFEMFNLLHQNITYKITASNHDVQMCYALELDNKLQMINRSQTKSLSAMYRLFKAKVVVGETKIDIDHVKNIYRTAYLPYVVPVAYTLSTNLEEILLLSHARINTRVIECMYNTAYAITSSMDGNSLTPAFCASTPLELAKSIDRLNERYSKHAISKGLNVWYPEQDFKNDPNHFPMTVMQTAPFFWGIWSRTFIECDPHPFTNPQHRAIYAHGHHRTGVKFDHIIELDNNCGKEMDNDEEDLPILRINGILDASTIFLPKTDEEKQKQMEEIISLQKLYEDTKLVLVKLSSSSFLAKTLVDIKKLKLATTDAEYENNQLMMESFKRLHSRLFGQLDGNAREIIEEYFFNDGKEFQFEDRTINKEFLQSDLLKGNTLYHIAIKVQEIEEKPKDDKCPKP